MPKKEVHIGKLQDYLPEGTYELVLASIREHKVHLTIARERKSVLGDYRHRTGDSNHRISVNGNLNQYSFLVTLLHELAHLVTFEQFGNKVPAHGKEWKKIYGQMLASFIHKNLFPADIKKELEVSMKNPAASSCAEDGLLRILRRYDQNSSHNKLIEELPIDGLFKTPDGRIFQMKQKLRKRYKCLELATKREYLFSPVYEVEEVVGG